VKFVLMTRNNLEVDRTAYYQDEIDHVAKMKESGLIERIYLRSDGEGAIVVYEAESEEVLRAELATVPYFLHGCAAIDTIYPVTPLYRA
jgi:hypothetical protein